MRLIIISLCILSMLIPLSCGKLQPPTPTEPVSSRDGIAPPKPPTNFRLECEPTTKDSTPPRASPTITVGRDKRIIFNTVAKKLLQDSKYVIHMQVGNGYDILNTDGTYKAKGDWPISWGQATTVGIFNTATGQYVVSTRI